MKCLFTLWLCFFSSLWGSYKLTHPIYNPGFFSVFNTVLGALDQYDKNLIDGLEVDFETNGLYFDPEFGANWWSYYFEPISLGKKGCKKFNTYQKIVFSLNAELQFSRERGYELIQKYIHLKPHINKKIETLTALHFDGEKVLGLHYRGTDKKSEAPIISYERIYDLLSCELKSGQFSKIFVATDEAACLEFLKERFPSKICHINAIRSYNEDPVHAGIDEQYKRGEDALIDCILLSKCSKLYKMASNLSDTSMKYSPNLKTVSINKSFNEESFSNNYRLDKVLGVVLSYLDKYEKNKKNGFEIYFQAGIDYPQHLGDNWWDYHFMPLCLGDKKMHLQNYELTTIGITELFEMTPKRSSELISKYIHVKPSIMNQAQTILATIPNSEFMGVCFQKSPVEHLQKTVSFEDVFRRVELALQKENQSILWVSDDKAFLNEAAQKFPNSCVSKLLVSEEQPPFDTEQNHLANLIALSKAKKIMGTGSSLLLLARKFNPKIEIEHLSQFWLEKQ